MVDIVATLEVRPEKLRELGELVLGEGRSMLLGCEDVPVLLDWNGLLAVLYKALKHDCEKLLQSGLDRALDRQTFRVHHLEAALHH